MVTLACPSPGAVHLCLRTPELSVPGLSSEDCGIQFFPQSLFLALFRGEVTDSTPLGARGSPCQALRNPELLWDHPVCAALVKTTWSQSWGGAGERGRSPGLRTLTPPAQTLPPEGTVGTRGCPFPEPLAEPHPLALSLPSPPPKITIAAFIRWRTLGSLSSFKLRAKGTSPRWGRSQNSSPSPYHPHPLPKP